ncbi:MAG: LPS-assembly protein LptD [Chromatiales bacterium]|nr:LPS-assembly protein LptD [Chromatiales bacterium]
MFRYGYLSIAASNLLLLSSVLFAEAEQCVPVGMPSAATAEQLRLSADRIEINPNQTSVLQGRVQLQKDNNRILADRVAVDADNDKLVARGNVRYTSCNIQTPPWFISADELTLDRDKQTGVIKRAWLHLGEVPFLYLPRYRLSLSENRRKSGLLPPRLSYNSNAGVEAGSPWYFNIAPNKDMTITPKVYSQRGAGVDVDARYLYAREYGRLGFSWLDDTDYDDHRYFYFFEHRARGDDIFRLDVKVQRVSDTDYIEDLASNITLLNQSYLRSYVESDLFWRGWHFNFQSESLQRADADANWLQEPYQYQLRPGLKATRIFDDGPLGMNFVFQSQAAQFVHKYSYIQDSDGNRDYIPVGNRFHNSLRMDWQYRRPWFFFTSAATINHTHYKLYRQDNINRTQPVYSLHSGLIFEKTPGEGDRFKHTLEPTLFYLNVPRRQQDDIPLFDTTANEFNFASLFSENRFNGIDRIGDADQLTVALNSRLLHRSSGKEALRASIGRIYYLREQRVRLNERRDENRPQSPLIGELGLDLNNKVKFLSSWVWDSKQDQTLKFTTRLSLKGSGNRRVNLYYRSQADAFGDQLPDEFDSNRGYEQAGVNLGMPLNDNWTMLAGLLHDFDADNSLSTFLGVRYRSCCWSVGFNVQRRLVDVDNESGRLIDGDLDYETHIGFEFNLEGLSDLGNNLDETLGNQIFGYWWE